MGELERNLRVQVLPRIGGLPLQAIDAGTISKLYAALLADGHRGVNGYAKPHDASTNTRPAGLAPRTVSYRYYALWLLLATTGLRRGEALGLRWSDIDLDDRVLSVSQTVITVDHVQSIGTPKTSAGARAIDLDGVTVAALRDQRRAQQKWALQRITLNGLRHTWATLALRAGVHPRSCRSDSGIRPLASR